jgi:RNA polymerase sigma factor (sigma-70 family)
VKGKAPTPRAIEDAVIASLREGHREFLRFVSRRTNSLDDAEDILQEFYLKAIRSVRTIKEAGALKGWLAQVLRRTLIDYYRRAAVRKAALQRLSVETEGQPVLIDDEAERAVCSCLYRILPTMPAEHSQLIWQVDLLGQPRSKVAKSFGISPNNLGVRLHRARRVLRAALERFCTTCPTHGFLDCACERPREIDEEPPKLRRSLVSGRRAKQQKTGRVACELIEWTAPLARVRGRKRQCCGTNNAMTRGRSK